MTLRDIKRAHYKQAERTANPHMHQWRQVVRILAKRGGRFVAIRKGQKLPTSKGWNKTENTLSVDDILTHLDAGGNAGHAAGTGNVYCLDFDRDAERGYECAQLNGGLHVRRKNAPDKAKFYFTCDAPVPTRPRSRQHGFDLLGFNANGTHAQSVIAGMHPTGDPYVWGGHSLPHLAIDTVEAIYADLTDGEELFPPVHERAASVGTYTDADLARVADALEHVDPDDMDYNTWIGVIAAIRDAFDGSDDAQAVAAEWANGKHGEVESKWHTFARDYTGRAATLEGIFYRARQNGWRDTWLQDQLQAYRFWLASPDAIAELKQPIPAPNEDDPERTRKLFNNPERARKLLDAILQKCETDQSLRITPGYAWLRKETGISQGLIADYLARLFTGGFINLQLGQKGGDATVIELVFQNLNSITPSGDTIQVLKNWKVYREFRADEAFLNNHAVYIATHPEAWLAQRYIGRSGKRLSKPHYEGEGLPLGDNGLGALLALLDGPTTISDAAELVGYTYGAMARTMRRFVEHNMVDVEHGARNRKTYTLKEEWRAILDTNRPKMTTATVQWGRNVSALKSKAAHLEYRGEGEKADRVAKEYTRQSQILKGVKTELGIIPFVQVGRVNPHREHLDRVRKLQRHGERAEQRHKPHGYKPKRPGVSIFAADAEWDALNAWAVMTYGAGWWVRRDVNGVLGAYEQYLIAQDHVPTMHWDGPQMTQAVAS